MATKKPAAKTKTLSVKKAAAAKVKGGMAPGPIQ